MQKPFVSIVLRCLGGSLLNLRGWREWGGFDELLRSILNGWDASLGRGLSGAGGRFEFMLGSGLLLDFPRFALSRRMYVVSSRIGWY